MVKFIDWEECLKLEYARKTDANNELIKSMLKLSINKMNFIKNLKIDEKNASFIFTNYYDCIRMLCESLCLKKGFKIYNHKCITNFLKTVIKEDESSRVFDTCRLIRNRINYYGKLINKTEANKRISDIKEIYSYLKNKYF